MSYPKIILHKGKEKSLERRHPWIFSGAIRDTPKGIKEGDVVEVYAAGGQFLAMGHYQVGSITVRLFSFSRQEADRPYWKSKLEKAIEYRRSLGLLGSSQTNMFRLIHGEGDGFPGLIVDYYAGVAVIQCHAVGFFLIREMLAELFQEILGDDLHAVYDKSEHTMPFKAPVEPEDKFLIGESGPIEGLEYGHKFMVNVETGQKTGFFLDQRENRRLLGEYSKGKTILNTFSYSGGFSIYGLMNEAKLVHSVDSSQIAVDLANENATLNDVTENHDGFTADVFKYLMEMETEYDLIVLDPPAFAKHKKVLKQALRGYRTINHKAIQNIAPGGILFTFSCSQVVTIQDFRTAVFSAAAMAGREVRIMHQLHQPADHPVSIYHPEGEYLKGLVVYVE